MIIKVIREEGDNKVTEVEHHNVKEFFILGNKKDDNGDILDFHDWKGSPKYLLSSLLYHMETIKDEAAFNRRQASIPAPKMELLKSPIKDTVVEEIEEAEEIKETKEIEETVDIIEENTGTDEVENEKNNVIDYKMKIIKD